MKKRRRGRGGREGQRMTGKDEELGEREKKRRSRSRRRRRVACLQVLTFVFLFVESQFL